MKLLKLFLITSCLISASFLKEAKSADFYVDQSDSSCADDGSASNFCSINAAVTFASDGDNVFIAEGTYTERDIDVTKFINISGAGIDKTVIDAKGGYEFNFLFLHLTLPALSISSMFQLKMQMMQLFSQLTPIFILKAHLLKIQPAHGLFLLKTRLQILIPSSSKIPHLQIIMENFTEVLLLQKTQILSSAVPRLQITTLC